MPRNHQTWWVKVKHFCLPVLLLLFTGSANAQLGQLFYELIDNGTCTTPNNSGCPTFTSTCNTGWVPAIGTPNLIPTTGWSCSVPCSQGTANCDPFTNNAIGMVYNPSTGTEGVYKPFYFQNGLTYKICIFYSISTSSAANKLTIAAKSGLTAASGTCQGLQPAIAPSELIGQAPGNMTSATFTYTPTTSYSQFLMFTEETGPQCTSVVTAIQITVMPVCATPSITNVVGSAPGQLSVTFTAVTGVAVYLFSFSNGTSTTQFGYDVPRTIPTGAFPATYTGVFQSFPVGQTYTVTAQAIDDAACSGGSSPVSPPSSPVTVTSCVGSSAISTVANRMAGLFVVWQTVTGATSYTIDFYNGTALVRSFNFTTNNGYCNGVPAGTYRIGVRANASCGSGPEAYYGSLWMIN